MADLIFIPDFRRSSAILSQLEVYGESQGHRFHAPAFRNDQHFHKKVRQWEAFMLNEQFETPPMVIAQGTGGLIAQLLASKVRIGPTVLINAINPVERDLGATGSFSLSCLRRLLRNKGAESSALKEAYLELIVAGWTKTAQLSVDPSLLENPMLILAGKSEQYSGRLLFDRYEQAEFHYLPELDLWEKSGEHSTQIFPAIHDWLEAMRTERSAQKPTQIHHQQPRLSQKSDCQFPTIHSSSKPSVHRAKSSTKAQPKARPSSAKQP